MKNGFLLVLVSVFILNAVSCTEPKKTNPNDEKWSLVWEDDFKGEQIDTTKWAKIPRGKSDWNNYMSDYDELYVVRDDNLVLRGIQNTVLANDTAPFLTGGVYTKGKKTFGFGRLEIKAKLNPAKGAWPAFWMLPEEGKWPDGGEIDIMERLSHDKLIYQTVHSRYTQTDSLRLNPPASTIVGINPDNYIVYALEKYPDSLVFYVNDLRTKNYPRVVTEHEGQFPFAEQEFYLLLDMQLGGSWVGSVNASELPVELYIDWVRYYEPKK
jgi:beta-glucanase (GH16 family)